MATAKPVIVVDIPGVREVTEGGREGVHADPLNARDLAEKIRRLLADPEARRVMGQRGREKVLESFGIELVTDQIENVYRAVLDRRKGATSRPCRTPAGLPSSTRPTTPRCTDSRRSGGCRRT